MALRDHRGAVPQHLCGDACAVLPLKVCATVRRKSCGASCSGYPSSLLKRARCAASCSGSAARRYRRRTPAAARAVDAAAHEHVHGEPGEGHHQLSIAALPRGPPLQPRAPHLDDGCADDRGRALCLQVDILPAHRQRLPDAATAAQHEVQVPGTAPARPDGPTRRRARPQGPLGALLRLRGHRSAAASRSCCARSMRYSARRSGFPASWNPSSATSASRRCSARAEPSWSGARHRSATARHGEPAP